MQNGKSLIFLIILNFQNSFKCHKNFYSNFYIKNELEPILTKMKKLVSDIESISKEIVKNALMDYINGTVFNQLLKDIKFEKQNYTE